MSKPLATKVSTSLSESPNWAQNVNVFIAPLFSSTALTLLGVEFTRASQVATGVLFHSSMTTSWSWWMLETLRSSTFHLRMPHRCSIRFRSGDMLDQSIIFTLSFISKAVVVVMLEYCPAAQSPKGGDHALLQYMLAFTVPSMNCSFPVPARGLLPESISGPAGSGRVSG